MKKVTLLFGRNKTLPKNDVGNQLTVLRQVLSCFDKLNTTNLPAAS